MALGTTLNSLSIRSLGIEHYGFVNESDGGDDLLTRKLAVIDDNADECYGRMSKTLKPPEKYECCDHEANSFPSSYYSYETDPEANFFLYPYETDHEAHVCLGKHGFNSTLDSGEDECYERMSKTLQVYKPPPEKYECCCHEANCSFLYPYETDHEANNFLYPYETDHEARSFISSYYPYETDHEAYSFFLNPYETDLEANSYPYETREVENKTKSTLHSQFQGGDLLSRMSVGYLGLESYGFISTSDSLMKTLSVRSLGLEEYGFIDED